MSDIIEEARAMLARATPGPWFISGNEIASDRGFVARGPALGDIRAPGGRDDAVLIAAAPRLLAALADECERLRTENARLREAMPGDDVRDEINDASVMLHEDGGMPATLAWLARLEAVRKGGG